MFYVACALLVCVIIYDVFKIFSVNFQNARRREFNNSKQVNRISSENKNEIPAY